MSASRRTRLLVGAIFFGVIALVWYPFLKDSPRWAIWAVLGFSGGLVLCETLIRRLIPSRGESRRYSLWLDLVFAAVVAAAATWFATHVYPG